MMLTIVLSIVITILAAHYNEDEPLTIMFITLIVAAAITIALKGIS